MLRLLFAMTICLSAVATYAAPVEIAATKRLSGSGAAASRGLSGSFYDLTTAYSLSNAQSGVAAMRAPTATFIATTLDYPRGAVLSSNDGQLADFLGGDAASLSGARTTVMETSAFKFDGLIDVDSTFDIDPATPGIQSRMFLGSDDGFDLKIGETSLASVSLRSFSYSQIDASFAVPGLYAFSLFYFENLGQSGMSLEAVVGGDRRLLGAENLYRAASSVPEPAPIGLLGAAIGGLAIIQRRRAQATIVTALA